jgi:hypothetical protein
LLEDFKFQADHFLGDENSPKNALDALGLMQHYGGATRLLDFTMSPHIALFFAYSSHIPKDQNVAIFAINYWELLKTSLVAVRSNQSAFNKIAPDVRTKIERMYDLNEPEQFNEVFLSEYQQNIVAPIRPKSMNKRLIPQNGLYVAQGNINISFENNLKAMMGVVLDGGISIKKYILSGKLRLQILDRLDRMGIREASLFPGLDGFARGQTTKLEIDYFRDESKAWEEKHRPSQVITGVTAENSEWNFRVGTPVGSNPYVEKS